MNGRAPGPAAAPLIPREQLAAWADAVHGAGRALVLTNGCFDILHRGHVEYLHEAALQGDVLLVAVNDDASVRALKGPGRPVLPQEDRCAILSHLRSVGALTIFGEPTPLQVIHLVRPDVLVKGAEYALDQIVGAEEVLSGGGRVVRVPMRPGRSSTGIIEAMRRLGR